VHGDWILEDEDEDDDEEGEHEEESPISEFTLRQTSYSCNS
jgi:hypothetical protein